MLTEATDLPVLARLACGAAAGSSTRRRADRLRGRLLAHVRRDGCRPSPPSRVTSARPPSNAAQARFESHARR